MASGSSPAGGGAQRLGELGDDVGAELGGRGGVAQAHERLGGDPADVLGRARVAVQRGQGRQGRARATASQGPGDTVVAEALAAAGQLGRGRGADQRQEERLGGAQAQLAGAPDRALERPGLGLAAAEPPARGAGGGQALEEARDPRVIAGGRRGRRGDARGHRRGRTGRGLVEVAGVELGLHQLGEHPVGLVALDRGHGLRAVLERRPALAVAEVDDVLVGADLAQVDLVDLLGASLDEDQPGLADELHAPVSFRMVPWAR
jgi:hypothetical protein